MKGNELRWGIAGCGRISGDFVRAMAFYCQRPNRVSAVASQSSLERAQQFCDKFGLDWHDKVQCFGSHAEMFAHPEVDIVYVANLNHQHRATVLAALEAGKHVLCEKPLGVNEYEVRQMVDKARRKGLFLMEGYWTRCFPIWREIMTHRLAQIGPVDMVQCDFGFQVKRVNSTANAKNGGEGYLLATGCYGLMAAQLALGRPVKVLANGGKREENGTDLWASILLRYPDAKLAQVFYSGQHRTTGSFTIFGQRGNIRIPEFFWSPMEAIIQRYPEGPLRRAGSIATESFVHPLPEYGQNTFYYPNTAGLSYEIDHVAECIKEGKNESDLMPLEDSVTLAWTMDEVRRQMGCPFPQDEIDGK